MKNTARVSLTNLSLDCSRPNLWTSVTCQIDDNFNYKLTLGQELQLTYFVGSSINFDSVIPEVLIWLLTPNISYQFDYYKSEVGLSYEIAFATIPGLKPYIGQRIDLSSNHTDFYFGISFSVIINKEFWEF